MTDNDTELADGLQKYRVDGWLTMAVSAEMVADVDDDIDEIRPELQLDVLRDELRQQGFSPGQLEGMSLELEHIEELDE